MSDIDYIKSELGTGHYVHMVVFDVQKAFECVNHDILCKRLELMGIDSLWFTSYLSNRSVNCSCKWNKLRHKQYKMQCTTRELAWTTHVLML